MQSAVNYEELVQREILAFPKKQLPHLIRLLRLLRRDFSAKNDSKAAKGSSGGAWREGLESLRGAVSSSQEFMARKNEEKALER